MTSDVIAHLRNNEIFSSSRFLEKQYLNIGVKHYETSRLCMLA